MSTIFWQNFFIILLFLLIFLEVFLVPIPLVIIFSIMIFLLFDTDRIFVSFFLSTLLLDMIRGNKIGASSVFIFATLFIIFWYRKNFNKRSSLFFLIFAFISSIIYSFLLGYSLNLLVNSVWIVILLALYMRMQNQNTV